MMARTGLRWPLWVVAVGLLVLTIAGAMAQWSFDHATVGIVGVLQAPLFLVGAWLLLARGAAEDGSRRALASILVVAALMRLAVIPAPPVSSDIYRYIWDGRVQAAGINPYRYVPADDALRSLRDEAIYPNINRADYAPTIYPPAAQMVFFVVTRVSESLVAMKAAMVAFEMVAIWALLQLLTLQGRPPALVLLYAWHPLPVWEFAGSGHADIVAIALLLLAFVGAARRWPVAAGLALATATLVKFFPVVTGPALTRRWDWRLPLAFAAGIAAFYLPYLGAGTKVFGFLGGYVAEEGFADGSGIFLLSLIRSIMPLSAQAAALYLPAVALALLALALALFVRPSHAPGDAFAATVLIFALLMLVSPHYAWYFCWLIPFLCVHPFAAGLYLTAAATYLHVSSWPPTLWEGAAIYGVGLVLLLAETATRNRRREAVRERIVAA